MCDDACITAQQGSSPVTAKELIQLMPRAFRPDAAGSLDVVIQYAISEPMYSVIRDGRCEVHEGRHDNPNVTIIMADEDLVSLMTGELDGMSAFMSGKLKLDGDMMLAQRLGSLFDASQLDTQ